MDMGHSPNGYEQVRWDRMYSYPANYQEALLHRKASKFGFGTPRMKDGSETPICPCCENYVNTAEIPLDYPTQPDRHHSLQDQVFMLPASIALYFTFVKMVIGYILLRFLLLDLYNIVTSINGRYCALLASKNSGLGKACTTFLISTLSGYNKRSSNSHQAMTTLAYLSLLFVVLSIAYFVWYEHYSYDLYYYLENNQVTQDDFTLLVQDIPHVLVDSDSQPIDESCLNYRLRIKKGIELRVRTWVDQFTTIANQKKLKQLPYLEQHFYQNVVSKKRADTFRKLPIVHTITICYDLTELQNLNRIRTKLAADFVQGNSRRDEARRSGEPSLAKQVPEQIKLVNSKYVDLCHLIGKDHHPAFTLSHFVGKAFVTFQYQHYRDYFVRECEKSSNFLTFNSRPVRVSKAPKPNDVFWYHMKVGDSYRLKHTFYSYLIMLIGLTFSLLGFIGLKVWRESVTHLSFRQSVHDRLMSILFSLLMASLTNVINILLGMGIQKLTEMERPQSKTAQMGSLIIKNIMAKFLNTTVIYFIFHRMNPQPFLSSEGLVSNIVGLAGFSAFIKVLMDLLQIEGCLKRWFYYWKHSREEHINLFQLQLNQQLQEGEFNLANQYSYYIYMTYLVSFYALLVPISAPIIIMVFTLQFWVDKYILFRKQASPADLGYPLTKVIIKCFECSLLILVLGNLYWHQLINKRSSRTCSLINSINVTLSLAYILGSLFCPAHIKQKLFGNHLLQRAYRHSYTFYSKNKTFTKLYWQQNPATSFLKEEDVTRAGKSSSRAKGGEFVKESQYQRFLQVKAREIMIGNYKKECNIHTGESTYSEDSEEGYQKEAMEGGMDEARINE